MKRRLPIWVGAAALAVIGACIALLALWRVSETRQFTKRYQVRTYGGTNYVAQLLETTVGKVQTGYVLIVYARFENPNPDELILKREWFVLVDHDKDYYQPTAGATQPPLIKLPPHGVSEKEALSFAVDDDAFEGALALSIGHHYFVLIKNERPWREQLPVGHFMTFRSRAW